MTFFQLGEASPVLRQTAGLDQIPGLLAATHRQSRARYQQLLGTRIGIKFVSN